MLDVERFKRWLAAIMTPLMAITSVAVIATAIQADTLTIPNSFVDGTAIVASPVNANNTAISTWANGNVANDNIKAAAGIVLSKLAQTSELFIKQGTGVSNVSSGQTGDTNPRVTLTSDGGIKFGAGGASALDSLIKRSAAAAFLFRDAADSSDATVGCGAVTSSGVVTGTGFTKTGGTQGNGLYMGASGAVTELTNSPGGYLMFNSAGNAVQASRPYFAPQGRLTLTSATPVTTSDVTAATTLYYTPYYGRTAWLKIGSNWVQHDVPETSLVSPTLTINLPYDIYMYSNSGTPTLEALAWTNTTTRATAVAYDSTTGLAIKSGDATRLYLGTIYATAANQMEDSAARRMLFNMYNRVPRKLFARDTTDSWTYATGTWRAARANTTAGVGRTDFVIGGVLADTAVEGSYATLIESGAGTIVAYTGIALNSTTSPSVVASANITTASLPLFVSQQFVPALGYSFMQNLEKGHASAPQFDGDAGTTDQFTYQSGWLLN